MVANNATEIAVGIYGQCLALQRDGTVYGWNENGAGEATGVPSKAPGSRGLVTINGQVLTNVSEIAAGTRFSLALRGDGTVAAWGRIDNARSSVTLPVGLSNVVAIAAGGEFCLAVTTNRAVAEKFRQRRDE